MMNIIKKINIDSSLYLFLLIGMLCGYIKDIVILLFIVLIHELGHVIFFRLFNIEIDKINIYPFGGICYVNKKINNRILYDVLINVGGLLMQVLLFIIFYYLWKMSIIVDSTYNMFIKYNVSIFIFNLLPIIPLDGSKLMLNIYCMIFSFKLSYKLMIITSIGFSILFVVYNVIVGINDLVIILFLLFQLMGVIKNYKYVIGKFYLERIIYDNYYDEILNGSYGIDDMKLNKYYYFYNKGRYVNEKDYLKGFK